MSDVSTEKPRVMVTSLDQLVGVLNQHLPRGEVNVYEFGGRVSFNESSIAQQDQILAELQAIYPGNE